ncbi:Uncharacterised protein [Klebsiella pneumoniae]|nr:Uncharacterised protein [Klebsiella pneumoniae]
MRLGGGDNFALRRNYPTVAPVMVAIAVGTDAIASGNISLIFDSPGHQ